MTGTILHVSPHPDDEVLGAGGTLRLLGMYDWRVHNLACSLGRKNDQTRRRKELIEAARRIEFYTTIMNPIAQISSDDDLTAAADAVAAAVHEMLDITGAEIVVSPHPHDRHHGHEAVARGVRDALVARTSPPTWWMWGLWADLPIPNLFAPFGHAIMGEVSDAIEAYTGENARNHYDRLYPARASAQAVLGAERVFGFGAANPTREPFADLLTEVRRQDGRWMASRPRILDPATPVVLEMDGGEDISWWVDGESVTSTMSRSRPAA